MSASILEFEKRQSGVEGQQKTCSTSCQPQLWKLKNGSFAWGSYWKTVSAQFQPQTWKLEDACLAWEVPQDDLYLKFENWRMAKWRGVSSPTESWKIGETFGAAMGGFARFISIRHLILQIS